MMETVLIVENDMNIRKQLKWSIGKKYEVIFAEDGREALSLFYKYKPKVVTLDLGLPPYKEGVSEGFSFLDQILRRNSAAKVIVLTMTDVILP